MDTDALFEKMRAAGEGLAGDIWSTIESFAIPELKKIAVQIEAIARNIHDFTPRGAKALLQMQVNASVGIIVSTTSLMLLAVQDAINAILAAVREFVNGALPFPLL